MRRIALLVLGVIATVGLAGCSSGETKIDKAKAEKLINDKLEPKAESVTCPDGVTAKAGVTFECQVRYADGDHGTFTVHIVDDKGNVQAGPEDLHIQK